MLARRWFPSGCFGALLTAAAPSGAWSVSKDAIRPMLAAARKDVRTCAFDHALPDGRYAVWIVVDARGRGKVELRDSPAGTSRSGRRCVEQAYRLQIYPKAMEATVAWSAASPPQATYSIAYPFELQLGRYGFSVDGDPLSAGMLDERVLRPRPARIQ